MSEIKEALAKAKKAYKKEQEQKLELEQLIYLNAELLQKLKVTEESNRSLMNYFLEMQKSLENNYNRTPIEEIWFRELSRFLKGITKPRDKLKYVSR